jgi:serine/threonine protein kinase
MGVVYEAEQISLGRRVALKVLPFAATMDPRQLQRFQNEARAAASLEHPHIVPVYGVGCDRAVHYYAMKFIDGQSLADLIRHERALSASGASHRPGCQASGVTSASASGVASAPRVSDALALGALPQPRSQETAVAARTERAPRDAASFRQIAEWGIQAAEALEHAHSLGIVHRDIKPANLMLDVHGKLWITDFGLARTAADPGLTMMGDLLGTLRYMSPEQALAKHGLVDHRTDIYSLGVTLYELLTREPVWGETDRQELFRCIVDEEPKPPRRINRSIPPELETILLKAMEKNPADRYATAQALADDLQRYLTNEPIQARRSSVVQRARKVIRRHPGVTVTAALAIVAGLLLGIAGLAVNYRMVREEQIRTKDALNHAEREKAIAQAVRYFLRDKLLAQADSRTQANALLKSGKPGDLKPDPTIRDLLNRAALELAPDKIEGQFPGQPLVQAELLKTVGEAYGAIGEYKAAISHLQRARDVQIRELAADHPDTLATITSLARTYLDARNLTEAARSFEQVRDRRIETLGPEHPDTLASMNDLARCYFVLGRHEDALKLRQEIVRLRTDKLGPDDPDTLVSMNNLANSYAVLKRFDEALELHRETLAKRKATLHPDHPDVLQSMNNVANCYTALGRHAEALQLHEEVRTLRLSKLGGDNPDTLQSMNNVAVDLAALGRHTEALKLHEETLALRETKLPPGHPDTLKSMNGLAWLLATCSDPKLLNPNKALALAKQTTERKPKTGDYWNTLGVAYYRTGDWKNAVVALTKSMDLRKGGDPTDWFFLAMAHWRLDDKEQARKWYNQAVGWTDKNKPKDEELRRFRAEAAELLGIEKK